MNEWQIFFGIIASNGVIAGINFQYRNRKKKDNAKEIRIIGGNTGTQTIQQAESIVKNKFVADDNAEVSQDNRIDIRSDKEMRDFIEKEMRSLSLIHADFNQLAQKFIGALVDWVITLDRIEKVDDGNCRVFFTQSIYSRVECFIVDPEKFPGIKFAKKNDKYRIVAHVKLFESSRVELNRVSVLEKK